MISTIICSFCPNPHPSKYPTSSPRTIRSPRIFSLDQSIYVRALGTHLICHHFTRRNSSNLYFRLHGLFSSARKRSTFRPLAERICVLYSCGAFRGFETHRICDRSMRRNLSNLFSTARIVIECSELIEIPTAPKQTLHVKHIYNNVIYSPRTRNLEGSNLLPHSIQSEVTENSVRVS